MAYLSAMPFSRLFHILFMLALLLAPAGMLGSHAAMAMPHQPAAAGMDHCDRQQNAPADEQRQSMIDCAIACTALPAAAPAVQPESAFAATFPVMIGLPSLHGSRPETATPPPRSS